MDDPKRRQDPEAALAAKIAELDAKMEQMRAIEARLTEQAAVPAGLSREDFLAGLTQAMSKASQNSELLASKFKPESADHLHRGPFEHPEGGLAKPKAALLRETWFSGIRCRLDELTYQEVEAINALNASLARSQRRVAHDGKWKAIVSDDDRTLELQLPVKTLDDRADLPSFLEICQELTNGERPMSQGELAQEVALLRSQMAELTAARI